MQLDTRHQGYATDAQGQMILDSNTRQPIQVAKDLVTGKRYGKVCESIGEQDPQKQAAKQEQLRADGAEFFDSDVPGYRGWWKEFPEPELAPKK